MELEPGNDDECSFEQIARENWQDASLKRRTTRGQTEHCLLWEVVSSGWPLFFFVGLSVGWSVGCPLAVCLIVC